MADNKNKPLKFVDGYPDITDETTRKAWEAGEKADRKNNLAPRMRKGVEDYLNEAVEKGTLSPATAAAISTFSETALPDNPYDAALPGPPVSKLGQKAGKNLSKIVYGSKAKKAKKGTENVLDYSKMKKPKPKETTLPEGAYPNNPYKK